ncbi:hypothetical protein CH371_11170 [Leptospira wolffii]|uniref:OLD protein-like TOPRIM domain-containing protein n=1 Tax=Leptospira wolffii TaxID=409998 RepID=A0A2M9ZC93_9LEPT|nr:DUF2813 domain-containing protein [Leptospira wolffii]PJZ66066.1 hypothetical protein CH371_11170 [Leptospira wolffii]
MRISKILLQNFRSFKNETIVLDDITVFVGENNTGKSTILDAIKYSIGATNWNEKFSRHDYLLTSATSHPGEAGDILIRVEVSEKTEDEWPDEIQQTLSESIDIGSDGKRHFILAFKGSYNRAEEKSVDIREFQNRKGITKGPKANSAKCLSDFRKLLPIFYISSLRDATKEYHQRRGLFRTFLDHEVIPEESKLAIEKKLTELNKELLDVLENIKHLKEHLKKTTSIINGSMESMVDIEPVPSDLNELIGKAGVILQNKTGVRLPLDRHGSGAQSLAVLFLYEAFLSVLLTIEYDKFSEPILLIEEPEAHLHPSAVRIFWRFLEKMPGQKIVSTHSGDIISNVPISKIRRIAGTFGEQRIHCMSDSGMSPETKRYLRNFITYSRGELFFARCWLIVEGETEQAFFENLLNRDGLLDNKGIRIIQYTQMNLETLLEIAKQLNIRWFLISDGDTKGKSYETKAKAAIPTSEDQNNYIYTMSEMTIEVHLMKNGFDTFYTSKLSQQTKKNVSGTVGSEAYYESVYKALNNSISKPQTILEIVDSILDGKTTIPPIVGAIRTRLELFQ